MYYNAMIFIFYYYNKQVIHLLAFLNIITIVFAV